MINHLQKTKLYLVTHPIREEQILLSLGAGPPKALILDSPLQATGFLDYLETVTASKERS